MGQVGAGPVVWEWEGVELSAKREGRQVMEPPREEVGEEESKEASA